VRELRAGEPVPAPQTAGRARVELRLEAENRPLESIKRNFGTASTAKIRTPTFNHLQPQENQHLRRGSLDAEALRTFSIRCAKCRNAISHEGEPPKNESNEGLHELAEALRHLYHALLLHEIGLDEQHLRSALTNGRLAEMLILPAFRKVGLNLPEPTV